MDTIDFIKMTFAEYKALSDIAPKTFYYITDTEDLYQGEKLLNIKFWEGTQAQYSAAIANGEIPDGTIVKITDSSVPTGSDITIDSALSSTSENPVQNKVIKSALDDLQENIISTSLESSKWSNSEYSFESAYPSATYKHVTMDFDYDNGTAAQLSAYKAAYICPSKTTNKVYCKGVLPTVNIPIILKVRRGQKNDGSIWV